MEEQATPVRVTITKEVFPLEAWLWKHGKTLKQLAELIGCKKSYAHKIVQCHVHLSTEEAQRVAGILGLKISDIPHREKRTPEKVLIEV